MLLLILGMAVVTYIPRLLPFFSEKDMHKYTFLKYIPVAMFSSLAIPGVIIQDGLLSPERMIAGIIAVIIAFRTKRMFLTIAVAVIVLYIVSNYP
jgi:branched-subunit amino acid transport protein